MENNTNDLEIGIGTKETISLEPKKVSVQKVGIEQVGEKKNEIVYLHCKHPDKDETIKISNVKYEKAGKLQVSSLWVNKDEDGNLRKGSAVAILLTSSGAENIKSLEGKEFDTIRESEDSNYLALKAY